MSASPPSLHSNPRMRHQQLNQQLRALQTTFQTYTTTPTPATLTHVLPALQHHLTQLTLNLPHLSLPLLLPALPTLLDVLDALADLPLSRVQTLVADVLTVLVWWSKGAARWVRGVEDKGSAVYAEVAERVREGYVRLGGAAEQWAAAVTLSASSTPAASSLLPSLLTSLTLSLPYLSPAPRDSSLDLLVSSLSSPAACTILLSSPHLVDCLTSLPAALSSSPPSRLLAMTDAVLSLWRRAAVVEVRPYDEYRAMMVYMAGVSALVKHDATAAAQLQQSCHTAVVSSASIISQSLFAVFGVVGMLHALDPKAAAYKRHQTETENAADSDGSSSIHTTVTGAASSPSSPAATVSASISSKPATSILLPTILALQSSFQSAVDQLIPSCSFSSALTTAAPSFATSQCGILSAACVNGIEWLQWSNALFSLITTAFLTLIDTRWCITTTASLSSPPFSSRNIAMLEWTRSAVFALLPHYSRAFSVLFLSTPSRLQCDALSQVRHRMRNIHRQWQRHYRASHDIDTPPQSATAMEEDSAEDEDEHSDDASKADETDQTPDPITTATNSNTSLPLSTASTPTQPPIDRRTLSELQNTLFLSVCMALATVCKPSLLSSLPASCLCDVADTLSWLEFVRVNFTAYRDVVVAVVNEGVRREAMDQQQAHIVATRSTTSAEQQPGWLSWLRGWRRHNKQQNQPQQTADSQTNVSKPTQQLVHTFIHSYLLPSLPPTPSTAASSLVPTTASSSLFSSTLQPLLSLDEGDLISLSRQYFLLGLLSEWQDSCTATDALSVLLPYSASFLHCRVRGVLKRAHGLFVRSLALIVRHHSLQRTDAATDGYSVFLSVLLPYARLALSQYPVQLGLPALMDSLVLLFHLLPSDHPLLVDVSRVIVDRIQQLTDRILVSAISASTPAGVVLVGDTMQVPTSLRYLLILHFQLVQLLSLPSFRSALTYTAGLFAASAASGDGAVSGGVYGSMLSVLRDVIVRNFDLYRRDEAVRWWMAVKQRSGIVLAVPGPPPPLPIAAPSITTIKPTT